MNIVSYAYNLIFELIYKATILSAVKFFLQVLLVKGYLNKLACQKSSAYLLHLHINTFCVEGWEEGTEESRTRNHKNYSEQNPRQLNSEG